MRKDNEIDLFKYDTGKSQYSTSDTTQPLDAIEYTFSFKSPDNPDNKESESVSLSFSFSSSRQTIHATGNDGLELAKKEEVSVAEFCKIFGVKNLSQLLSKLKSQATVENTISVSETQFDALDHLITTKFQTSPNRVFQVSHAYGAVVRRHYYNEIGEYGSEQKFKIYLGAALIWDGRGAGNFQKATAKLQLKEVVQILEPSERETTTFTGGKVPSYKAAEKLSVTLHYLSLPDFIGKSLSEEDNREFSKNLFEIFEKLNANPSAVYFHCKAGVWRSFIVSTAFLVYNHYASQPHRIAKHEINEFILRGTIQEMASHIKERRSVVNYNSTDEKRFLENTIVQFYATGQCKFVTVMQVNDEKKRAFWHFITEYLADRPIQSRLADIGLFRDSHENRSQKVELLAKAKETLEKDGNSADVEAIVIEVINSMPREQLHGRFINWVLENFPENSEIMALAPAAIRFNNANNNVNNFQ